ncbi:MAG: hypothetical protein J5618_02845 [Bacilli bacterium]|nr:hypothetical protein [Bacilli bacterium]
MRKKGGSYFLPIIIVIIVIKGTSVPIVDILALIPTVTTFINPFIIPLSYLIIGMWFEPYMET